MTEDMGDAASGGPIAAHQSEVPDDPWKAFAWFINRCAGGFGSELMARGRTAKQARNVIIGCFLQMAAGEACRMAREEGREPDPARWREVTDETFERAVRYTGRAKGRDESPVGEADAPAKRDA